MRRLVFVLTSNERYHKREIANLRQRRGVAVYVVTPRHLHEQLVRVLDSFNQEEVLIAPMPGEDLSDWYEFVAMFWRKYERPVRWTGY